VLRTRGEKMNQVFPESSARSEGQGRRTHVLIRCGTPVFPRTGDTSSVCGWGWPCWFGRAGGRRAATAAAASPRFLLCAALLASCSFSCQRVDGLHGIAALPGRSAKEFNAGCIKNLIVFMHSHKLVKER